MTGGSGITGNDVVNETIKLAKSKTNITGFIMDDFSSEEFNYPLTNWIKFALEFGENWDGVALIYGWLYMM